MLDTLLDHSVLLRFVRMLGFTMPKIPLILEDVSHWGKIQSGTPMARTVGQEVQLADYIHS
jgi:hypothetical protein